MDKRAGITDITKGQNIWRDCILCKSGKIYACIPGERRCSDGQLRIRTCTRPFCIGRKNWLFCNTERGAQASANIYSISETAKLNNLRPLKYFEYILTQLPYRCDDKGKIDPDKIEDLMPWSDKIPEDCRKKNRWFRPAVLLIWG